MLFSLIIFNSIRVNHKKLQDKTQEFQQTPKSCSFPSLAFPYIKQKLTKFVNSLLRWQKNTVGIFWYLKLPSFYLGWFSCKNFLLLFSFVSLRKELFPFLIIIIINLITRTKVKRDKGSLQFWKEKNVERERKREILESSLTRLQSVV